MIQLKKYLDLLIINILFLLIAIALYFLTKEKVEILAAVIATGISLSLGVRQYKTENDKIFKELFLEFNSTYNSVFRKKLDDIIKYQNVNQISKEDKILITDYLNFCAEEYLWYTKGRIPKRVWLSWKNGMMYYLKNSNIKTLVLEERGQKDSYYGLFDEIGNLLN